MYFKKVKLIKLILCNKQIKVKINDLFLSSEVYLDPTRRLKIYIWDAVRPNA